MAKYPGIEVQLSGKDGNAVIIISTVCTALRRAGVPVAEVDAFRAEAKSRDFAHVLNVCEEWVTVY